MKNRYALVNYL